MNKHLHVKKSSIVPVVFVIVAGAIYTSPSSAQIVTDGSFGAAVTLSGLDVEVVETLGTRAGNNLFHSFETFNIVDGGVVTFTGSTDITNVVSRVTGGEVSNINGALNSEVGSANFFFVNPAGVTFGAGASVDVPASFHLSTADELRFDDGSVLTSSANATSVLSMATPEAFGFLGNGTTGSINVDGEIVVGDVFDSDSQATVTISASNIVAGDSSFVQTPGATRLAAVGESAANYDLETGAQAPLEGELEISGNVGFGLFGTPDDVLVEAGTVEVSGTVFSEDSMRVNARDITVTDDGTITGTGTIDLQASNQFSVLNGGRIGNDDLFGASESVAISAGQLLIDGQGSEEDTGIISELVTIVDGRAADTEVDVAEIATIQNGGQISIRNFSDGVAGNIALTAGQLTVDDQGSDENTGVYNETFQQNLLLPSTGTAGNIEVFISEITTVQNGGQIVSFTRGEGNAGNVAVTTDELVVDSQGSDTLTGIFNSSASSGNAGSVEVSVTDLATIQNGGRISNITTDEGVTGNIALTAGRLTVDNQESDNFTGVSSEALAGSTGDAGPVEVFITEITAVQSGGQIHSTTQGEGNAGNVVITTGQLVVDDEGSDAFTGIFSDTIGAATGNAGNVEIAVTELATIQNGGAISSETFSEGNAGNVVVSAGQLLIDRQGVDTFTGIFSSTATAGNAGNVEVTVTELATIQNGGLINNGTRGAGSAGNILVAAEQLFIDDDLGSSTLTGITSDNGDIDVTVSELATMQDGGVISSSARGERDGGNVAVTAGQLLIDGQFRDSFTGILSDAGIAATGSAGSVDVTVTETATIQNRGTISSTTFGEANAGSVAVSVAENITIQNGGTIRSDTLGQGDGGTVNLAAAQLFIDRQNGDEITGISSAAQTFSTGNAGSVEVSVTDLVSLRNGGIINSGSVTEGDAGSVVISAGRLEIEGNDTFVGITGIDSSAQVGSSGNAGSVEVSVAETASIRNGGVITSDTFGIGDAGNVMVSAGQLLIDRQDNGTFTGISSEALTGSTGNAGNVQVAVTGLTTVLNGGQINSNTLGVGNAGNVLVNSRELLVDGQSNSAVDTGILSFSTVTGSGGTVEVNIEEVATVRDRGQITTSSFGEGDAGNVTINSASGSIAILRGSQISSAARGDSGNSGSVVVDMGGRVVVERADISTESQNGESGSISVSTGALSTNDVIIATTTESLTADGGDINLNSEVFALQDTVIQANATSGTGGEITIDSSVIPFATQFNTQLDTPLNLSDPNLVSFGNVAQAVAPTGLSVPPAVNSPEVDISGALSELDSDLFQTPEIGANPCSVVQSGAPSTLIESGRGGLPNNDLQQSISSQQILNKSADKDSTVYFIEQKLSDKSYLADSNASGAGDCYNTNI